MEKNPIENQNSTSSQENNLPSFGPSNFKFTSLDLLINPLTIKH